MSADLQPVRDAQAGEDFGLTLRDQIALRIPRAPIPESWGTAVCGKKPPMTDPLALMEWWADVEAAYRYTHADAILRVRRTKMFDPI